MVEKSREEFEERLAALAAKNPEFRKALLNAPKEALTSLLGQDLPAELTVAVHEEDASTLHFVLPPAGNELTAAEMTNVSGGVCWSDCVPDDNYSSGR